MTSDLIPYLLLLIAILLGWGNCLTLSLVALASATAVGLIIGRLEPLALVSISSAGFFIWLPVSQKLPRWGRGLSFALFLALAVAMSNYMVPGFKNLLIYDGVRFSSDSIPFTMYLNFDKTTIGIFIYLFLLRPNQPHIFTRENLILSVKTLTLLTVLLMPVALFIHYVRLDPKFPSLGWIWILNNLFFVCLAEEGLFRGLIQGGLVKLLPKNRISIFISILVTASLFGLAHYKGGMSYVALAALAGLFYGYAYQKTGRIESSMLVHFGLNLIHFLAFSYPALGK